MKKLYLISISIALTYCCCSDDKDNTKPPVETPQVTTYHNPVLAVDMADPTIIKARDGYFYIYATESTRSAPIPIYKSKDLVSWTNVGAAFTTSTRPSFEPNGGLWAPDINYINDLYVLYYSMPDGTGGWTCGVGVATSIRPDGGFFDRGPLLRSNEIGVQNSIDPFYIEEAGKKYMFWGSFKGIYGVELASDGLSIKQGAKTQRIAGDRFEGAYIHKNGDYYYLFVSIGSCCNGLNSSYELVVGRSNSLFGPYVTKAGKDMRDNGYDVVVGSSEAFVGNGHCSEIVQDDAGNDWILYHGFEVKNVNRGRILLLDQVKWVDGWPVISNGTPSLSSERPVFK